MEVILGAGFAAARHVQPNLSKFAVIGCRATIDDREQCAALEYNLRYARKRNGQRPRTLLPQELRMIAALIGR